MFVDKKIFESYFSDRLTFSNIHSRTSRQIYRLALPLLSTEALITLSKSRIFLLNILMSMTYVPFTMFVHFPNVTISLDPNICFCPFVYLH